ncbi:MAG: hypothetical protein EOP50_08400 [Sphingobacteriales bacterium]|nr:MAG: hypothetical protein EOP50_08400 [Sphingobacteriales bacterium]
MIVPLYAMYFTALHYFGKALAEHPEVRTRLMPSGVPHLVGSYSALQSLHKDKALLASLSPSVQQQFHTTSRYLLLGTLGFLIMILAGLCGAVLSKA